MKSFERNGDLLELEEAHIKMLEAATTRNPGPARDGEEVAPGTTRWQSMKRACSWNSRGDVENKTDMNTEQKRKSNGI